MSLKTCTLLAMAPVPWTGPPATRGHPYREIPGGRAGDSQQAAAISLVSTKPRHDVACPVSWPQPHQDPLFPTQFVISGSLSVAAEKSHTSCLVSLNGGPGAPLIPLYSAPPGHSLIQQTFPGGLLSGRSRRTPNTGQEEPRHTLQCRAESKGPQTEHSWSFREKSKMSLGRGDG